MTFVRTACPPTSNGTASPSTYATMSTRSLDPEIRAPMTTSPGGSVAPGAGSRLLMIGYKPGDPTGLAARSGDAAGRAANGSSVGVNDKLDAGARVGGA